MEELEILLETEKNSENLISLEPEQAKIIPSIGENENWFINGIDTGKPSRGEKGKDGINGIDGKDGINGKDGVDGTNGVDGYTPVRGNDFWTEEDIKAMQLHCEDYIDSQLGTINEQLASLTEVE